MAKQNIEKTPPKGNVKFSITLLTLLILPLYKFLILLSIAILKFSSSSNLYLSDFLSYINRPISVGVIKFLSAAKSIREVSISWPIPVIIGILLL